MPQKLGNENTYTKKNLLTPTCRRKFLKNLPPETRKENI